MNICLWPEDAEQRNAVGTHENDFLALDILPRKGQWGMLTGPILHQTHGNVCVFILEGGGDPIVDK